MKEVVDYWREKLGIKEEVILQPISREQVVFPDDISEEDKYYVGITKGESPLVLLHDRPLTEDDIVHELLHVAFPNESEDWINAETNSRISDYYLEQWMEAERKRKEKDENVLKEVKSVVSEDLYEDILLYVEACGSTYDFSITEEAPDDKYFQKEDELDYLTSVWCNQYTNGGYIGDAFAGQIWIKISDTQYLTFHYSM